MIKSMPGGRIQRFQDLSRRIGQSASYALQFLLHTVNRSFLAFQPHGSFTEDLHADSLDLFELAMALEEEFSVEIPSEDLEKITTVGDVIAYIEEHK